MSGSSEESAEAEKANDDAAAAEVTASPKRRRRRGAAPSNREATENLEAATTPATDAEAATTPATDAEAATIPATDAEAATDDAVASEVPASDQVPEPSDAELEAVAVRAAAEDPAGTASHDAPEGAAEGPATSEADAPPARALSDIELAQAIEAMLFASHEPLTHSRLAQVLGVTQRRVRSAIERLREEYLANSRAFDVREIAGGFKLYTRPEFDELVARLERVKPPEKLTGSGLETLAIIAYKQPITRAQIDAIRGVHSGAMLKTLTEKKLIRVAGRADQPGRPIQYGTTKRFLDHFGLASVEDLPRVEDLKAP